MPKKKMVEVSYLAPSRCVIPVRRPPQKASIVAPSVAITQRSAHNLVDRLVEAGLLREITGYARNRRFRFDPYLRLFEEPEEARA